MNTLKESKRLVIELRDELLASSIYMNALKNIQDKNITRERNQQDAIELQDVSKIKYLIDGRLNKLVVYQEVTQQRFVYITKTLSDYNVHHGFGVELIMYDSFEDIITHENIDLEFMYVYQDGIIRDLMKNKK